MRPMIRPTTAVVVVYVAAIFLSTMDTTIVNVALPSIGDAFSVPSTSVDSITISFLVSLAVFIPASGWLGDRFGGKRILLVAIAIFTGASVLCGLASSLGELVAYRILQGLGGGMLAPVGMAMVLRSFAPAERVRALSTITIATALAPTIGPTLGGLLVTNLSWHWVFFVNAPVGVCAFVFALLFVRDVGERRAEPFDVAGFVLSAAGLGLLMYGISEGPDLGWTAVPVLLSVPVGAVLLTAMVLFELRRRAPMIDIGLFRDRLFRSSTTVMTVESVAFLGAVYTVSLYLQDGRGLSPLVAGMSILPQAFGVMLGSQIASRLLYPRLGPRVVMAGGVAGTGLFIALLGSLAPGSTLWCVWVLLLCMGLSVGHVFVSTQAAAFATISQASSGRASTIFNVGRRLGGALGIAAATTTMVLVEAGSPGATRAGDVSTYRVAFLVVAALALLAVWPALAARDSDAATTVPASGRSPAAAADTR
ncbi:MDR family MFS transporter [Pseudonocardia aurantiaca]